MFRCVRVNIGTVFDIDSLAIHVLIMGYYYRQARAKPDLFQSLWRRERMNMKIRNLFLKSRFRLLKLDVTLFPKLLVFSNSNSSADNIDSPAWWSKVPLKTIIVTSLDTRDLCTLAPQPNTYGMKGFNGWSIEKTLNKMCSPWTRTWGDSQILSSN